LLNALWLNALWLNALWLNALSGFDVGAALMSLPIHLRPAKGPVIVQQQDAP
jgi:hypothetical protein